MLGDLYNCSNVAWLNTVFSVYDFCVYRVFMHVILCVRLGQTLCLAKLRSFIGADLRENLWKVVPQPERTAKSQVAVFFVLLLASCGALG